MSKAAPRYPVYVVSKGRHDCCLTARFLVRDGVDFKIAVETQERDLYAAEFGAERVIVTPFSNLGLGSYPVRNFVWEHARQSGATSHWVFDDNIRKVLRLTGTHRIPVDTGIALAACEDFVDRYENVGVAGLNYDTFGRPGNPPFLLNVRVYSCLLIRNEIPWRWRGPYNEDTDLCLNVLAGGLCTILFNAFLIQKVQTMTMKGGNVAQLYQGDGRLKMARRLERWWPYVVETKRRFQRPQHVVRDGWRGFDTRLKLRAGVDPSAMPKVDDRGMRLVSVGEVRSASLRAMLGEK